MDKPTVDLWALTWYALRCVLVAHASMAVGVPAVVADQVLRLLRDVLRDFRQEVQCTEDLEIAAIASVGEDGRSGRLRMTCKPRDSRSLSFDRSIGKAVDGGLFGIRYICILTLSTP